MSCPECDVLRAELARLRSSAPIDVLAVYDQEDAESTTVVARIAALGLTRSNALSWAAGAAVREEWLKTHKSLPPKANTAKSSGHGSHCHARYPLSWCARIDGIIRACAGNDPRQLSLFGDDYVARMSRLAGGVE